MKILRRAAAGLLLGCVLLSCAPCPAFAAFTSEQENDKIILDMLTEVVDKLEEPIDREAQLIIANMIRDAVNKCEDKHLDYHEKTFNKYDTIVAYHDNLKQHGLFGEQYNAMVSYYDKLKKKKKTGIASGQQ